MINLSIGCNTKGQYSYELYFHSVKTSVDNVTDENTANECFHQEEKARKEGEEAKKRADDDARKKMILGNLSFTGYKVIVL